MRTEQERLMSSYPFLSLQEELDFFGQDRLVDPVATDFKIFYYLRFVIQPFFPSFSYFVFVDISFRELDKHMVMAGFAFHEAPVKFSQVFVVEAFAQAFETLAAAGFY